MQVVGAMRKVHLVVGRNNAGKSNLLHFAHGPLQFIAAHGLTSDISAQTTSGLDWPRGMSDETPWRFSIGLYRTQAVERAFFEGHLVHCRPFFETIAYTRGYANMIWFDFMATSRGSTVNFSTEQVDAAMEERKVYGLAEFNQASLGLTSTGGGGQYDDYLRVLSKLQPWRFIPEMRWVDTLRRITSGANAEGSSAGTRDGTGLVNELAKLQHPGFESHAQDSAKWRAFVAFVRAVLDDVDAHIEVPNDQSTILVATNGQGVMPVDRLGTGLSEVITIAAAATTVSGKLICLEEPELHLHPTLQRMLARYLVDATNNHYLVSTHSASMLNADIASITHVSKPGHWSTTSSVITSSLLATAVSDLGNRASDIVQSNFIVWVEGPSDRIYISDWIAQVDPELIEGVHYSIVFYGGALLNHLSADDEQTDEFINLLQINRNLALVMDSDLKDATAQLNATKRRVLDELEKIKGTAWVTAGYTIENYVPTALMQETVGGAYPTKTYVVPTSNYSSPLAGNFDQQHTQPSKITVARAIVDGGRLKVADWSADLKAHVDELVSAIRLANGV